jgi:hypothetical protein
MNSYVAIGELKRSVIRLAPAAFKGRSLRDNTKFTVIEAVGRLNAPSRAPLQDYG